MVAEIVLDVLTLIAMGIVLLLPLWGHNLTRPRVHDDAAELNEHLGLVSNYMLRMPWPVKMFRYFLAFMEPYFLRLGEMAVRHFGRRGFFFRGPLKIIPLLLGWVAKQFFTSEVYTCEEVEHLLRNLRRKYRFTIATQGICPCRKALGKYSTVLPNATDFQILADSRIYPKIYNEYREVPVEFVIKKLRDYDLKGLVHTVFGICGVEGSEVAICNCSATVCFPLRAAIVGLFPVTPGYTFVKVEASQCDPDCPQKAWCLKICQMRARQIGQDGRVMVNAMKCIGCGVCRPVCPNNANTLVERGKKYRRILPRILLEPNAPVGPRILE